MFIPLTQQNSGTMWRRGWCDTGIAGLKDSALFVYLFVCLFIRSTRKTKCEAS